MATEPSVQRGYRAACPNCGAPVEFRSPASAFAVCSFCRSTIVRDGDALKKIGESAELFDDHSPLQLGAAGHYNGAGFTLVGRVQYRYAEGTWNEWHALFDSTAADGEHARSGWLSEDNGGYVFAFDLPLAGPVPAAGDLRAGQRVVVDGQSWAIGSVSAAKLIAAQGELPRAPNLTRGFMVADLRNTNGEVGTLDYSDAAHPVWSVGRSVAISELAMTGLAEATEKTLTARGVTCPNCGAALEVKLASTRSIVCHQCHAVVDLVGAGGDGVGAQLQHYTQDNPAAPQIPLGSIGTFAFKGMPKPWQVVGYAERCEVADGQPDAQSFWREYLLYNRSVGFTFIVDAQDGWSWSAPITGVPEVSGGGVRYRASDYRKLYDYVGMVTYVLGEFYWQVTRHQRTANTDYQCIGADSSKRLNREATIGSGSGDQATQEVIWSAGETLTADQVMIGFKLPPEQRAALQRDALPTSLGGSSLLTKILLWGTIAIVVLILVRCATGGSSRSCESIRTTYGAASQEYQSCLNSGGSGSGSGFRTGGGAFGGFSSGGSHK